MVGLRWFFLTVALLQGLYAVILVAPKGRLSSAPWYLIMGASFNLWLVGFYAITRTVGIPLFGPHAGHVEGLGVIDMLSKTLELGSVAALSALLFWRPESREVVVKRLRRAGMALLATVAILAILLVPASLQGEESDLDSVFDASTAPAPESASPAPESTARALPTLRELVPLLTRGGSGDQATMVDVLYAPPLLCFSWKRWTTTTSLA